VKLSLFHFLDKFLSWIEFLVNICFEGFSGKG